MERGQFMLNIKEKSLDLRQKLGGRVLVGDGAMSTLLAVRAYSRANLMPPASMPHLAGDVIEAIH